MSDAPAFVASKRRTIVSTQNSLRLVVEVAESSLAYDRTIKLPLYARAGIGEVWIVDLKARLLEAFRRPLGDAFAERTLHHDGERVALALAPEIVVEPQLMFAASTPGEPTSTPGETS